MQTDRCGGSRLDLDGAAMHRKRVAVADNG